MMTRYFGKVRSERRWMIGGSSRRLCKSACLLLSVQGRRTRSTESIERSRVGRRIKL